MTNPLETVRYKIRKPITLIGMMGVGKTRLGVELAKRLGMVFIDSDTEIERAAGCTIAEIFEQFGEQAFRDGERRVIRRLIEKSKMPKVIATGGGAITTPETLERLHGKSHCLWLCARVETLVDRTARNARRPLLNNGDPAQILTDLLEKRRDLYNAASHAAIQVDDQPLNQTVDLMLEALSALILQEDDARQPKEETA